MPNYVPQFIFQYLKKVLPFVFCSVCGLVSQENGYVIYKFIYTHAAGAICTSLKNTNKRYFVLN